MVHHTVNFGTYIVTLIVSRPLMAFSRSFSTFLLFVCKALRLNDLN